MGRSGGGGAGGGGGGRPSGGFGGGGRVSGGFSGGSRSGGGGGGRSGGPGFGGGFGGGGGRPGGGFGGGPGFGGGGHHGGPGHGPDHGPGPGGGPQPHGGWGGFGWGGFGPTFYFGPRRGGGPGPGGGCGSGCAGGCGSVLLGLIIVLLLAVVLSSNACSSALGGGYGSGYGSSGYSQTSSSSATVREKLSSSAVTKTAWYTDEDGEWVSSEARLTDGLSYFYEKTGVQPYIYILKNGTTTSTDELTEKSRELYGQLFTDEGHFLLVFCDDGQGSFNCGYTMGSAASSVIDSEALDIISDALIDAYNTASTDEEVFSDAFRNAADQMMAGADQAAAAAQKKSREDTIGTVGLVIVGVAVAGGVVWFVLKKKKEKDAATKARADEILNTPLEKFGDAQAGTSDKDVEDLASKYEKK